jgi:hypothetical protein
LGMVTFARLVRPLHVASSQEAAHKLKESFPGACSVIPPRLDTDRFRARGRTAARARRIDTDGKIFTCLRLQTNAIVSKSGYASPAVCNGRFCR